MATTWIVLVNWNGGDDTVECLDSLIKLNEPDYAVVVVDNGSTDNSIHRIVAWAGAYGHERFTSIDAAAGRALPVPNAGVTLLCAGRNLGFAAANNLGMAFASADPAARYYWILNNDTIVAPDSLAIQLRRMEADPMLGMLGARLMFHHRQDVVQGLAGRFLRWRGRSEHIGLELTIDRLPPPEQVEGEMSYVLGASMFVRRAVVDQIGGMSERYFLYFEELDWARRLPRSWRIGIALDAVVWHKEGGSIGSSTLARPSETSLYYIAVNLLRFYARFERLLLPVALIRLMRDVHGYRRRGDASAANAILRGLADAARGRRRQGHFGSTEFEATIPVQAIVGLPPAITRS